MANLQKGHRFGQQGAPEGGFQKSFISVVSRAQLCLIVEHDLTVLRKT